MHGADDVVMTVQVEADRGEDIGRIVQRTMDLAKIHGDVSDDAVVARPKRHDLPVKKIIGVASQRECEMLNEQVRVCFLRGLVRVSGGWLIPVVGCSAKRSRTCLKSARAKCASACCR